jgi:RNA polymerase sigma factor (sigma-70 family)
MTSPGLVDPGLARRAGAFLLELHAMSRSVPLERFQPATLSRLRSDLPFRSAWWGTLRARPGIPVTLHSNFVDALPSEFVPCWEAVKHEDELAAKVLAAPGIAASVETKELRHNNNLLVMVERFGIGSASSIAVVDPGLGVFTFLSLYRGPDAAPFDGGDRCLQEIVMPHLAAAWHANWLHHLEGMRAGWERPRDGLGVTDRHGLLHVSDPSFSDLMRSEWPRWHGSALPVALQDSISRGGKYDGRQLSIEASRQHDLTVLRIRPRSVLDRLSPREAEIATWYREGLSYKQIAARLACSPYTVRHHLRAIYDKLGVSNKAALVRLTDKQLVS